MSVARAAMIRSRRSRALIRSIAWSLVPRRRAGAVEAGGVAAVPATADEASLAASSGDPMSCDAMPVTWFGSPLVVAPMLEPCAERSATMCPSAPSQSTSSTRPSVAWRSDLTRTDAHATGSMLGTLAVHVGSVSRPVTVSARAGVVRGTSRAPLPVRGAGVTVIGDAGIREAGDGGCACAAVELAHRSRATVHVRAVTCRREAR